MSLGNLLDYPFVKARVASGDLALHGAWFDVSEGALHVLDRDSGDFAVLNNDRAILDRRPRNGDDPRTDDRKRSAVAGLVLF